MNIREMLGFRQTDGDIGLEIEVEGHKLPNPDNTFGSDFANFWKITQDGSLRGEAWEYVFHRPLSLEGTQRALDELVGMYRALGSDVYDSVRAGIHVHVNVQKLTFLQLMNMLVIYYCLETVLVNFCGKDRVGNHFCLRARDAEYIIHSLYKTMTSNGSSHDLATDNIRYASMNLAALFKYGSVEFRALRSTKDTRRILVWVGAMLSVREAAKTFNNPKEIIESMSLNGGIQFISRILGDLLPYFEYKNMEEDILHDSRIVQGLVFKSNWREDFKLNFETNYKNADHALGKLVQPKNNIRVENLEAPIYEGVEEPIKNRDNVYIDELFIEDEEDIDDVIDEIADPKPLPKIGKKADFNEWVIKQVNLPRGERE